MNSANARVGYKYSVLCFYDCYPDKHIVGTAPITPQAKVLMSSTLGRDYHFRDLLQRSEGLRWAVSYTGRLFRGRAVGAG